MNLRNQTSNISYTWFVAALLFSNIVTADQRVTKSQLNPKNLIGKEVRGNRYPDGWKLGPWAVYERDHNLVLLTSANVHAFVLERPSPYGQKDTSLIVNAVSLKGRSQKGGWYDMSTDCRGPTVPTASETSIGRSRMIAEVLYKKCARYSKKILSAWVVDLEKNTISPHPSDGMQCGNTYLDSGEIPECKFIPREW